MAQALGGLARRDDAANDAAAEALAGATVVFATLGTAGVGALREASFAGNHNDGGYEDADDDDEDEQDGGGKSSRDLAEKDEFESRGGVAFRGGFETVLVDEAGQAVEAEVLAPLRLGCRRLLLVGDPMQLPATTFSRAAERAHFGRSLMARLMQAQQPLPSSSSSSPSSLSSANLSSSNSSNSSSSSSLSSSSASGAPTMLLDTQYRMAEPIARFPAASFSNFSRSSSARTEDALFTGTPRNGPRFFRRAACHDG